MEEISCEGQGSNEGYREAPRSRIYNRDEVHDMAFQHDLGAKIEQQITNLCRLL